MLTGCTGPNLSDKNEFQLFSRTVAPETEKAQTVVELMRQYVVCYASVCHQKSYICRYDWKKAAMTTNSEKIYLQTGSKLTKELRHVGVEILKTPAFEPGQFKPKMLSQIRHSGIRIVILLCVWLGRLKPDEPGLSR